MTELWKPIPGYEGLYEASTLGRIRSVDHKTTGKDGRTRSYKGKILEPQLRKNYGKAKYWISLCKDGKMHMHILARLVAMTWVPGYEEGLTVDHVDGNCRNNNINNLEWVTWQENLERGFRLGIMKQVHVTLEDNDGNQHSFVSRADASRFLGRYPTYITSALQQGLNITSIDGKQYRLIKGAEKEYA